jgi:hypothetical protein
MPEVLLSNDDITVLGPPPNIEVLVDIGPEGQRGSQFFVGVGNPNTINIGQVPELNDLFLNAASGSGSGDIYQYKSEPGGNTWVEVLNIFPSVYSVNYDVVFDAGNAEIVVPISDIIEVTGTSLTAENFSVQYSIVHDAPIASSMQIPPLAGLEEDLVINLEAIEYVSSAWSALDEQVTVHIHITIVESGPTS